mgnify:CR=1 FL=1
MCGVRSCGCVALVVGCGVARLLDCCVALLSGCGVALLPARPVDLRARGEGVVEYPGKVACPSGRRCSTRNAVWCHSHPGFKSQRYRHCRPAPLGPGGFVMPSWRAVWLCGPTGVPGAGGPGRCVCRWAAARPRVVRAASRPCCVLVLVAPLVFWAPSGPAAREIATRELRSEWSISKPARALRTLRRPPHRRHLRC